MLFRENSTLVYSELSPIIFRRVYSQEKGFRIAVLERHSLESEHDVVMKVPGQDLGNRFESSASYG